MEHRKPTVHDLAKLKSESSSVFNAPFRFPHTFASKRNLGGKCNVPRTDSFFEEPSMVEDETATAMLNYDLDNFGSLRPSRRILHYANIRQKKKRAKSSNSTFDLRGLESPRLV
eukprot:jgi/Bigna1/125300/aug1.1_g8